MSTKMMLAVVAFALALATGSGPALGSDRVEYSQQLGTRAPGSATGMTFHVVFRAPGDPDAKPSPIRSVVLRGPDGLRFDSAAAPQCTASDAELHALGTRACSTETEVGAGTFTAMTGFGPPVDPFVGDDHVLNGDRQLIEVITVPGTSVSPGFDRLSIDAATLTAHPPVTPGGPPDGETAPRSIDFTIPVRTHAGRSLITTPASCPGTGAWTFTGTFTFADGVTVTATSQSPCERHLRKQRPHRHP